MQIVIVQVDRTGNVSVSFRSLGTHFCCCFNCCVADVVVLVGSMCSSAAEAYVDKSETPCAVRLSQFCHSMLALTHEL